MGDDDDLESCVDVRTAAWAKLVGMNAKLEADSDYYTAPPTLEETLRDTVPALKDAWDQYQVILRFAKAEHYAKVES